MGHLEGWGVGPPVIENIIVAASTVGKPTVVRQHSSVYNQMVLRTALRALSAGGAGVVRTDRACGKVQPPAGSLDGLTRLNLSVLVRFGSL